MNRSRLSRLSLSLTVTLAAGLTLLGCAPTVSLKPADNANAPECAEVTVRLPAAIGEFSMRTTDAQATAAWGDPTAVVFACGLDSPAPTTLQCVTIGSVDWIVDETDLPNLRLTTYGRQPAAQAYVDTTRLSADSALEALSAAVQKLPKTGACTSPDTPTTGGVDAPTTESGDSP